MGAREGERREIRCPADGSLVAEIDEAGPEDTARRDRRRPRRVRRRAPGRAAPRSSAARCCTGSPTCWSATRPTVARAESLDTGKRLVESEYDVDDVVGVFRHYGNVAAEDAGRVVDTGRPDVVSRIVHEPSASAG